MERPAMSRRLAVVGATGAVVSVAAAAFVIVGGLPGVLYACGILTAGLFAAVKLGVVPVPTDSAEGRWRRKSVVIAELRAEIEDQTRRAGELGDRLEREAEEARALQEALEVRIGELERAADGLQALVEEERARFEQFLGRVSGGIGHRGDELAALERDLTALVGS
jgi:hypothetical protein